MKKYVKSIILISNKIQSNPIKNQTDKNLISSNTALSSNNSEGQIKEKQIKNKNDKVSVINNHPQDIEIENSSQQYEEDSSDISSSDKPIMSKVRSTSFRDIKSMEPRGYGKMNPAYLTKSSDENMTNINENNSNNNSSSKNPDFNSLEDMRRRNEETWKILGYDPTHGKGDMHESLTLNNFNPKKLILDAKKWEESQKAQIGTRNLSDVNSSVPKKVLQSYSLCIKPAFKHLKRVNSSNNPLDKFIGPASSSNQEEESNNDIKNDVKPDQTEIPPNAMTAASLLEDNNKTIFDYEEEEEEFEEEDIQNDNDSINDNDNDSITHNSSSATQNSSSTAKASSGQPMNTYTYDFNNAKCNNFNKYNYNYKKANVSDLLNDNNSYFENSDNEEQNKPLFYYFLEQQKTGRKSKPKPAPKTPPKRSQKKRKVIVDYSHYDDPRFDWYSASKILPEGLQDDPPNDDNETDSESTETRNQSRNKKRGIQNNKNKITINFPKTSIVRRALCGESMIQYPIEVSNKVITDLRVMLEQAISLNMVDECAYLDQIINNIKKCQNNDNIDKEYRNEDQNSNSNSKILAEKLEEAQMALDNRQQKWESKKRILESEKQLQLEEVNLRYEEECKKLDKTWQTEKKINQFNRPSTTLIKMRQQVKIQLSSHKFGDASHLAQQMIDRDRKETEDASRKMQLAYKEECDRLKQKFEEEQKSIIQSFDTKLASLSKKQNEDVLPFQSRIIKYNNSMEENKVAAKRAGSSSSLSKSIEAKNKRPMTRAAIGRVQINGSLKLPPLKSLSKPPTPICSISSSSSSLQRIGKRSKL